MKNLIGTMFLGTSICFVCAGLLVLNVPPPHHFAEGLLSDFSKYDRQRNDRYSHFLAIMDEPSLAPSQGKRSYRFFWLRTFHHPVSVRVTRDSLGAYITAVELSGAGGYDPGKVLRRQQTKLTDQQADEFERALEADGLWTIPAHDDVARRHMLDGAEWVIEASTTKQRVITRMSPKNEPARLMGERFLSLTGWEFGDVY